MITIEGLSKLNEHGSKIIDHLSFEIEKDEIVTIFGPNGCGKSTLLNILSGLDDKYKGSVKIEGKDPKDTNIGFVFQNYNDGLLPWYSVIENILINNKDRKARAHANALLKTLGLENRKKDKIYNLSGGQKQLVSFIRAYIKNPDLLLLDEPCSALDYSTTKKVESIIIDLLEKHPITTLCISHDVDEAILLADRVIVLGPRPTKIKAVIKVDLPRPRHVNMIVSDEFDLLRKKVLSKFKYD
jgi:NitT/TauT family transport system ATP-binding protein